MRSNGQIAQKLKQARYRHVKREIRRLLDRNPDNCKNNRTVKTPSGKLGVCKLDCQTCDVWLDRSPECPDFDPLHTKDEIKDSLKEFFQTRTVPEIAVRFPDVAALLWVLAEDEDPQAGPLFPEGQQLATLFGIDIWVDTPEEFEALREVSENIIEGQKVLDSLASILDEEAPEVFPGKIRELLASRHQAEADSEVKSRDLGHVSKENQKLREERDQLRTQALVPVEEIPSAVPWWRRIFPWQS